VLVLISIFIVPVMFSRYGIKKRKMISAFFAVFLIAGFGVGTWYLTDTIGFLGDISVGGKLTEIKEDYVLVVDSSTAYEEIAQLTGAGVGTHMNNDGSYRQAKDDLQREVAVEYKYLADLNQLFDGLAAGGYETINATTGYAEMQEYSAVFVSKAAYESLKEEREALAETTRVLHTVSVVVGEAAEIKSVDVTKQSFNVYLSGLDFTGDISQNYHSDVNMLVTVNPVSHEVLITSIPRDYYVKLLSRDSMDKLTHTGLYGIQETVGAIEDMMGIDINYYVKVNYNTVVTLVDAMGGIEIDSPYAFTTHGMQELNGIQFVEGYNKLNGSMALAYCRERKSWADGDMRRNENQQLIMEAIIKKATSSTAILTNYTGILEAVRGNMETSMTTDEMTSLVKMQLADMPSWDIRKNALKGRNDYQFCYALGFNAAVVNQDQEKITRAADMIISTMNNGMEEK
jgi:LCP family protein required for cell wall assembly